MDRGGHVAVDGWPVHVRSVHARSGAGVSGGVRGVVGGSAFTRAVEYSWDFSVYEHRNEVFKDSIDIYALRGTHPYFYRNFWRTLRRCRNGTYKYSICFYSSRGSPP